MTTNVLTVSLASGEPLDVRVFAVEEGMSRLFDVCLTVVSTSVDVDFEASIGKPASFEVQRTSAIDGETRYWNGICVHAGLVTVEETGLSHYMVRIVPKMWLLTQRRNYRVFQDMSELDVVLQVLSGWGIQPTLHLDAGSYPKRRIRIQYAETDFDFVNRLLEDIGVAYYFEQNGGDTALILSDAPNKGAQRPPVIFLPRPTTRGDTEYVTAVRTHREVKPGRYTQSDVDYRKALNYPLASSASQGNDVEAQLERYHHNYGSFLWKAEAGGDTPTADDRGAARTDEGQGATQVNKRLQAQRIDARVCSFTTIAHDLRPGKVFTISGHPRDEIAAPLLIVAATFRGAAVGEWVHLCEARYTDVDYRPPLRTPKPRTHGVESATVTGPAGEEIHTDEFGRVRVHFHWDREGASDETSSCWVPVSQPWAGAGFGAISLARVGQEVLVDFLGADPDRPVVTGRVFTTTTPPPYQLPKYKMVSGLRSETYPRPKSGGPQQVLGGGLPTEASLVATGALAAPSRPAGGGMPVEALGGRPAGGVSAAAMQAIAASAPAGGGMPVEALGGGDGTGAPATANPAAVNGPGIFGGLQAPPDELYGAVARMQSLGPDAQDHSRHANGLVFDDKALGEKVYLQSQNDLFMTVKRNFTASVGANRAFMVMGNDYEEMPKGYQATKVGLDRTVEVQGQQTHTVTKDIVINAQKNHVNHTQQNYYVETIEGGQVFQAKAGIMHRVGGTATILMTPTCIVIDAPLVLINPGPDVMAAINAGTSPEAAAAAKAKADRIAAGQKAIVDWLKSTGWSNADPAAKQRMLDAMQRSADGHEDWMVTYTSTAVNGGATGPGEAQQSIAGARAQMAATP